LFVAEYVPELQEGFEDPILLREFGLVLTNADGFDRPGVFRGVLSTTALVPTVQNFAFMFDSLGWSGDGSPRGKRLHDFAIGAIAQHLTQTLQRIPGEDFRLPIVTQDGNNELDDLEAFQLSLGRQDDLDFTSLNGKLKSARANLGFDVFAGFCSGCHFNGNISGTKPDPIKGDSSTPLFRTRVDASMHDGVNLSDDDGDGSGLFKARPLIEAADTAPFFHNHFATDLELAVSFYNSENFNRDRGKEHQIKLSFKQVEAVSAFLRVINVLENLRSAQSFVATALDTKGTPCMSGELAGTLILAQADINDAIDVLHQGNLHAGATEELRQALLSLDKLMYLNCFATEREEWIQKIQNRLNSAREKIIEP